MLCALLCIKSAAWVIFEYFWIQAKIKSLTLCGVRILLHALICERMWFKKKKKININSKLIVEPKYIFSLLSCLHRDFKLESTSNPQNSCMYSMMSVSKDECFHTNCVNFPARWVWEGSSSDRLAFHQSRKMKCVPDLASKRGIHFWLNNIQNTCLPFSMGHTRVPLGYLCLHWGNRIP